MENKPQIDLRKFLPKSFLETSKGHIKLFTNCKFCGDVLDNYPRKALGRCGLCDEKR